MGCPKGEKDKEELSALAPSRTRDLDKAQGTVELTIQEHCGRSPACGMVCFVRGGSGCKWSICTCVGGQMWMVRGGGVQICGNGIMHEKHQYDIVSS